MSTVCLGGVPVGFYHHRYANELRIFQFAFQGHWGLNFSRNLRLLQGLLSSFMQMSCRGLNRRFPRNCDGLIQLIQLIQNLNDLNDLRSNENPLRNHLDWQYGITNFISILKEIVKNPRKSFIFLKNPWKSWKIVNKSLTNRPKCRKMEEI